MSDCDSTTSSQNASVMEPGGINLCDSVSNVLATNDAARNASPYIRMAQSYIARGNFELALKQLQKANKKAPCLIDVHFMLGEVFLRLGHIEKATDALLKVYTELHPGNATAGNILCSIATGLYKAQKFTEANVVFSALLYGSRNSVGAHPFEVLNAEELSILYTTSLMQSSDYNEAISVLKSFSNDLDNEVPSAGSDTASATLLRKRRKQTVLHLFLSLYELTEQNELFVSTAENAVQLEAISYVELGKVL
jgi:Tfp pilus assembly protein PilF